MDNVYSKPSFYCHVANGILLLIAFILLCKNRSKVLHLESHVLIGLLLMLSLAIGIHGVLHLGLEKVYDYNPLAMVM